MQMMARWELVAQWKVDARWEKLRQIPSGAWPSETPAVPVPDGDSIPIGSQFATIPGRLGYESTTVRVLLLVLIGEDGLKGAAMQIQVKHILGGERLGRHRGVENLVDPRVAQRVAPFYELAPENASWGHLTGGKRTRWLLPVRVACREHGCCDRCKEQHLALRRRRHAQHESASQP